jgi:hypothetical protein
MMTSLMCTGVQLSARDRVPAGPYNLPRAADKAKRSALRSATLVIVGEN